MCAVNSTWSYTPMLPQVANPHTARPARNATVRRSRPPAAGRTGTSATPVR